ncbi:MAG TPA: hypothetical protein PLK08_07650, partial [Phycisphaerae bacterium]|nr:hypothetical protein [Phycisphaerae bacterium]
MAAAFEKYEKSFFAAVCLASLLFCVVAVADDVSGIWVDIKGQAAGTDEHAREAAVKDAQINAIKAACGE